MLDKRQFNGGLNSDDEDRVIPNGDYRYALNIRSGDTDKGSYGAIENIKGDTLVVNSLLPAGVNKVIGTLDFKLTNKLYYFVYNDLLNHSIFEFNPVNDNIDLIFQGSILDFRVNALILSPQIIGGNLYFTDGETEIKCIDIERGRNFFTNSVTGVVNNSFESPIDIQDILLIKYPPTYPATNVYFSKKDVDYNNVRGKLYQFKYKYVYYGNQESAWSEIGKLPLPLGDDFGASINQTSRVKLNNAIKVSVNTGSAMVKSIKIAVREVGGNDAELTGDFVLWKNIETFNDDSTINPVDDYSAVLVPNTEVSFNFLNDEVHIPISEAEPDRLFNNVPYKAKDMCLINGSRLALFNIEDGNDGVKQPVIKTQVVYNNNLNNNSSSVSLVTADNSSVLSDGSGSYVYGDYVGYSLVRTPNPSFIDSFDIRLDVMYSSSSSGTPAIFETIEERFEYPSSFTNTQILQDICNILNTKYGISSPIASIGGFLNNPSQNAFGESYLDCTVVGNEIRIQFLGAPTAPPVFFNAPAKNELRFSLGINTFYSTGATFKRGVRHNIGIIYKDNGGRVSTVQVDNTDSPLSTIQDSSFFVDWYNKTQGLEGDVDLNVFVGHTPPEWATHWQFVLSKNRSVRDFIQFSGHELLADASVGQGVYRINLNNLLNYGNNINANVNYTFSKGDRIRFIKDKNGNYFNEYFESEIIKEEVVGSNTYIFLRALDLTNSSYVLSDFVQSGVTPSVNNYFTFEIFTPNKDVDKFLYFEVGEVHPIINPNTPLRLHGFNTTVKSINNYINQTSTSAAQATLRDIGDTFFKTRFQNGNDVFIDEFVESYRFSDFFNSFAWNQGRANIEDKEYARTERETTVRYSEPYVPETNIDGLASFLDLSFETYDWQYGSIQKVHPEDGQIIVFQELKVGKILVSEKVLFDSNGNVNSVVGSTDNQVLYSKMSYYAGEYGIGKNPESFAVYGRSKYFIDALRGVVLRLGGDGLTPISMYKMSTYFEDKFNLLVNSGQDFNVFGVYNIDFNEYILAFEDVTDDSNITLSDRETISFSEDKNRWNTFYDYYPDNLSSSNINLVSFMNGELYKKNSSNVYNNLHGFQSKTRIDFVTNQEPAAVKFYKSIYTESTDVFTMPAATNQFGQLTQLDNASDWEKRENVYYASFLRDINSPGVFSFPLLEGDNMRCHSMEIKLENNSTDFQKLFLVSVRSEKSMLTNY